MACFWNEDEMILYCHSSCLRWRYILEKHTILQYKKAGNGRVAEADKFRFQFQAVNSLLVIRLISISYTLRYATDMVWLLLKSKENAAFGKFGRRGCFCRCRNIDILILLSYPFV